MATLLAAAAMKMASVLATPGLLLLPEGRGTASVGRPSRGCFQGPMFATEAPFVSEMLEGIDCAPVPGAWGATLIGWGRSVKRPYFHRAVGCGGQLGSVVDPNMEMVVAVAIAIVLNARRQVGRRGRICDALRAAPGSAGRSERRVRSAHTEE